ncbi:hypothetical protein JMJ77_0009575, partial [Colletotrichum scovillei]
HKQFCSLLHAGNVGSDVAGCLGVSCSNLGNSVQRVSPRCLQRSSRHSLKIEKTRQAFIGLNTNPTPTSSSLLSERSSKHSASSIN